MSTTAQALAALKNQITGLSFTVYWQGDPAPVLPDTPTAFAYCVFDNEGARVFPVSFGGGRNLNTYRNRATLSAYTFTPNRYGAALALTNAEAIAALLRSYRDTYVSCFAADVILIGPGSAISVPGMTSAVNNYQCAVAEISLHFDQIG